ncbi:MAG: CO dehydrogenase/CO-methylating acetyl-CoA synthase complex subunit beta, partial [Lachnospiraceae bacterium]|nr:CO dehydrogenase/CO-methylating acetyl-CoA synthase complex subunit beta [Lachnospiraceae bacterium]
MYAEAEEAVNAAIAKYGEEKAVGFPETAYALAAYYAETGDKITNLKECKEGLAYIKTQMPRERRLDSVFKSGVATALAAEILEVT